jgi:hypothetical protein
MPGHERRRALVVASVAGIVVLLALVSLRLLGWPVDGIQARPYRGETWFVAGLMLAAAALALAPRTFAPAALAVAGGCALQLVGTGITARRRWLTSAGFGTAADNLAALRTVAALLSVVTALAALAVTAALVTVRRRGPTLAWWRVGLGAAVAALAPYAMGWEEGDRATQLGGHGLMYGPWGVVLAGAALLPSHHRRIVDASLVASGVATLASGPMIPAPTAWLGVVVLVAAVVVAELLDQRARVASSRNSAVSGVGVANA